MMKNKDTTFIDSKITIYYDDEKNAILEYEDPRLFVEKFPSAHFLKSGEIHTNTIAIYGVKEIKPKNTNPLPAAYFELQKLDFILQSISPIKQKAGSYTYKYEIFGSKKLTIYNRVDYHHLQSIDQNFLVSLDEFYNKFTTMPKSQKQLHATFLIKAIESTFKTKSIITFDELIENWNDICSEYELLHTAYLDTLDTNALRFDYQKKLQEFSDRLNSIMSDIQNKALIPPIAIVLVLVNIYDKSLTVKILTSLLLFFFVVIIVIYQYFQIASLEEYKTIIKRWESFYKKSMNKQYTLFKEQYNQLYNRIDKIKFIFTINIVILLIMFAVSFAFIFTPPST